MSTRVVRLDGNAVQSRMHKPGRWSRRAKQRIRKREGKGESLIFKKTGTGCVDSSVAERG
jgi:hypothetical protein